MAIARSGAREQDSTASAPSQKTEEPAKKQEEKKQSQSAKTPEPVATSATTPEPKKDEHVHTWEDLTTVVHHEAETAQEWVVDRPVHFEYEEEYVAACTVCGYYIPSGPKAGSAILDHVDAEHAKAAVKSVQAVSFPSSNNLEIA